MEFEYSGMLPLLRRLVGMRPCQHVLSALCMNLTGIYGQHDINPSLRHVNEMQVGLYCPTAQQQHISKLHFKLEVIHKAGPTFDRRCAPSVFRMSLHEQFA